MQLLDMQISNEKLVLKLSIFAYPPAALTIATPAATSYICTTF